MYKEEIKLCVDNFKSCKTYHYGRHCNVYRLKDDMSCSYHCYMCPNFKNERVYMNMDRCV